MTSLALTVLLAGLTGCALSQPSLPAKPSAVRQSTKPVQGTESRLRMGDQIQVRLDTSGSQVVQSLDVTVDENGEVSLPLINQLKAEGLTPSELAERVQASYVPRYYVHCNVSVLIATRFVYVGGEVRSPGRLAWTDDLTLTKGVLAAGGFTDFANRARVEVTRGKDVRRYNLDDLRRNPLKDVPLQPGDSIWIPRSVF